MGGWLTYQGCVFVASVEALDVVRGNVPYDFCYLGWVGGWVGGWVS